MSILRGTGDGKFELARKYDLIQCAFSGAGGVAVGDFDQDGKTDVAVAVGNCFSSIFYGNGDGTLRGPEPLFTGERTTNVLVGDFRGDGKVELAFVGLADLRIFTYSRGGQFDEDGEIVRIYAPQLVTLDFDRDGHSDLALLSCDIDVEGPCEISLLRNTTYGPQRKLGPVISGTRTSHTLSPRH
jgi:hypothetical protein